MNTNKAILSAVVIAIVVAVVSGLIFGDFSAAWKNGLLILVVGFVVNLFIYRA